MSHIQEYAELRILVQTLFTLIQPSPSCSFVAVLIPATLSPQLYQNTINFLRKAAVSQKYFKYWCGAA
jgi:hypothetical protein